MGHVQGGRGSSSRDETALPSQQHGDQTRPRSPPERGIHHPIGKAFGVGQGDGPLHLTVIFRSHPAQQAAPG